MSETLPLPGLEPEDAPMVFHPKREAGLARLDAFGTRAGRAYAGTRNYDFGPDKRNNVSCLSPWLRHRLVTEEEVLRHVLARHSLSSAEKFVQEVFWRAYFKGWLEQRPSVWTAYRGGLDVALEDMERDGQLRADVEAALAGQTGIAPFDAWAKELVDTGYLHNHARMWFASIWIFTLRLPWEIGADFFLRHLLDGDPASNTLSWRWVAGLHTKGKTYAARASNISKYTNGRFNPLHQLSSQTDALIEDEDHPRIGLPLPQTAPDAPYLLLVTEEDCAMEQVVTRPPAAVLGLTATSGRSPLPVGDLASGFACSAVQNGVERAAKAFGLAGEMGEGTWEDAIAQAANKAGLKHVVTAHATVGPVAEALSRSGTALDKSSVTLTQLRRPYDTLCWPHATKGFFALKKKIPAILTDLGLRS